MQIHDDDDDDYTATWSKLHTTWI